MRRLLVLAVALLALSIPGAAHAQKRGDRSLITRRDLNEAGNSVSNALDAVQRLRPNWLRPSPGRQASSGMIDFDARTPNASEPVIYIDERRQPNLDALRTVNALRIVEIKYMDQNRAVQMMGPGHEAGAILITTDQKR